jgi:hypothetical protein
MTKTMTEETKPLTTTDGVTEQDKGRCAPAPGSGPLIWTCDKCGMHPYRPYRERLIGMGCLCGGTFRRIPVTPNDRGQAQTPDPEKGMKP